MTMTTASAAAAAAPVTATYMHYNIGKTSNLFDDDFFSSTTTEEAPALPALLSQEGSGRKRRRRRRHKKSSVTTLDSSDCSSVSSDGISQTSGVNSCHPHHQLFDPELLLVLSQEEKDQYVALDCEMVGIGRHGKYPSLARVCIIDWDGNTLLDVHVRQRFPVTDYRTFVSGVTERDLLLDRGAVDLNVCQVMVQNIIEDRVIVGHALKNDLRALGLVHPWQQIRDTAKYEPFMKDRFQDGTLWPRKLKDLAYQKLRRTVQKPGNPHCPFEDARTALDLYKRARNRWEKAMDYKISKTQEIEQYQRIASITARRCND